MSSTRALRLLYAKTHSLSTHPLSNPLHFTTVIVKECLALVIKDYDTHTLSGIRKRRLKESSSQTTSSKNSLSHLLVKSLRSRPRKAQAIALTKPRHTLRECLCCEAITIEFLNAIQPLAISLEISGSF